MSSSECRFVVEKCTALYCILAIVLAMHTGYRGGQDKIVEQG
jgi:hypothetical protein